MIFSDLYKACHLATQKLLTKNVTLSKISVVHLAWLKTGNHCKNGDWQTEKVSEESWKNNWLGTYFLSVKNWRTHYELLFVEKFAKLPNLLPNGPKSVEQLPRAEPLAFHRDKAGYQCVELQAARNMSRAPTSCQAGTQFPSRRTPFRSSHEGKMR